MSITAPENEAEGPAAVAARLVAGAQGRRAAWAAPLTAALALLVGTAAGAHEAFFSRGAQSMLGERLKAFASQIDAIVGDDPIVFIDTRENSLPTLIGRHRLGNPSPQAARRAEWVVMPLDERFPHEAVSEELAQLHADNREARRAPRVLALYRRDALPDTLVQDAPPPGPATDDASADDGS